MGLEATEDRKATVREGGGGSVANVEVLPVPMLPISNWGQWGPFLYSRIDTVTREAMSWDSSRQEGLQRWRRRIDESLEVKKPSKSSRQLSVICR